MKITVCQINPSEEYLDKYLTDLSQDIQENDSNFLLLPEMGFADWLAAEATPSEASWKKAVLDHEIRIAKLGTLGAKAVLGTRPIVNTQGSRRNEAYIWAADTKAASGLRQKYYLPDEPGYWEHSWYDRGLKSFDTGRALGMRLGVQICTEMWFFEWSRHYGASRADLLCVPRATPHGSVDKWLAG